MKHLCRRRAPLHAAALAAATLFAHPGARAAEPPPESPTPREGYEERIKIERRRIVLGERIYFEHGRGRILDVSFPVLNALAAKLRPAPQIELIQIEGHTDSVGPGDVNQKLSAFRARAVRDYLVQKGVPEARLVAKGFGEQWPISTNLTDEGREKNRRVEFVIIQVLKRHVWRRRAETKDYAVAVRASFGTEERGPEGAAQALAKNQPVYPGDVVETAEGAGAILRFPGIVLARVRPGSALRIEAIRGDPDAAGGRHAHLRLSRGAVSIRAYLPRNKKGARVTLEAGGATITFENSEVRVAREPGGARVEVLDGEVAVQLAGAEAKVTQGQGLRVDTVASTLAPTKLPRAPGGHKPNRGSVDDFLLTWNGVPGAASYVVEVARDVDFLDVVARHEVDATMLRLGLGAGQYYWRVRTRAPSGFESVSWPIYKILRSDK